MVLVAPTPKSSPEENAMDRVIRNTAKIGSGPRLHASRGHPFRDLALIVWTILMVTAFVLAIRP